jgi:tripartite-type tricarboxylate transporter receptor subunit TctC
MTGIDMLHVPYRGDPQALTDLLGMQLQVYFGTMAAAVEHIKSSRLRALAVTSATRAETLSDIPAIAEFVPGYDASGWTGIVAPKNTAADIVDSLNRAINAGLADRAIRARIGGLGGVAAPMTPAEFGSFILEYTNKWAKVIRAANIKVE